MRYVRLCLALMAVLGLSAISSGESLLLPVAKDQDAYTPCVAYGKDVFIVCWQSGRLAPGDLRRGVHGQSEIVGIRVDANGRPIDARPFVISAAQNKRQSPRIAYGNGLFLVVWHDFRNNKDWDIYAARVTPEGKVLDPEGIPVSTQNQVQALPQVAWDGQTFQVVWQDYRSGNRYEVYGARISADGKLLDPEGQLLVTAKDRHRFNPVIASNGQGASLLIWYGDVRLGTGTIAGAVRIQDGKAVQSIPIDSGSRKHGPGFEWVPLCLTHGGTHALVAWATDTKLGRDSAPYHINAMILSEQGQVLHSLHVADNKNRQIRDPQAVWDGKDFIVVWHEGVVEFKDRSQTDAVFASRVSPEGQVASVTQLAGHFAAPAAQASIASDGQGLTLVAYEQHPTHPDTPIHIAVQLLRLK